jgi:hypothetical protein
MAESGERYHQAVIFTSCGVRSRLSISGGPFAHRFDYLVADTVVADARAVDIAVAVGATGLEQPMAIGELVIEVDLRWLVSWVEDLDAVESEGDELLDNALVQAGAGMGEYRYAPGAVNQRLKASFLSMTRPFLTNAAAIWGRPSGLPLACSRTSSRLTPRPRPLSFSTIPTPR